MVRGGRERPGGQRESLAVAAGMDLPAASAVARSRAGGPGPAGLPPGTSPSTLDSARAVKSGRTPRPGPARPCACGLRRDRTSRKRCHHLISPKAPFQPGAPALVPRERGLTRRPRVTPREPQPGQPWPDRGPARTAARVRRDCPHLQKSGKQPSHSRAAPQSLPGSQQSPATTSASDPSITCTMSWATALWILSLVVIAGAAGVLGRRDEAFLPGPLYPFPYLDPAAAGTDGCPGSAQAVFCVFHGGLTAEGDGLVVVRGDLR